MNYSDNTNTTKLELLTEVRTTLGTRFIGMQPELMIMSNRVFDTGYICAVNDFRELPWYKRLFFK